jgi:hypothetical protein
MSYKVSRRSSRKSNENNNPNAKGCCITAEQQRVLLIYFVQDYSCGCPDCDRCGVLVVTELFPPFLIDLLVSNRLIEEEMSIMP